MGARQKRGRSKRWGSGEQWVLVNAAGGFCGGAGQRGWDAGVGVWKKSGEGWSWGGRVFWDRRFGRVAEKRERRQKGGRVKIEGG